MAEEPPPFGGRVVRGVDSFLDIASRLGEHLAHLARHRLGDGLLPLDQQIPHPTQHVASRGRRGARPEREAALGRPHRRLEIGCVGIGKPPDQVVSVRRVAIVEVGAVGGGDPLASDEVAERLGHRIRG